jgi:hypothetical protein
VREYQSGQKATLAVILPLSRNFYTYVQHPIDPEHSTLMQPRDTTFKSPHDPMQTSHQRRSFRKSPTPRAQSTRVARTFLPRADRPLLPQRSLSSHQHLWEEAAKVSIPLEDQGRPRKGARKMRMAGVLMHHRFLGRSWKRSSLHTRQQR